MWPKTPLFASLPISVIFRSALYVPFEAQGVDTNAKANYIFVQNMSFIYESKFMRCIAFAGNCMCLLHCLILNIWSNQRDNRTDWKDLYSWLSYTNCYRQRRNALFTYIAEKYDYLKYSYFLTKNYKTIYTHKYIHNVVLV